MILAINGQARMRRTLMGLALALSALASAIIGETFVYRVYLPPDYQRAQQKRYPVLYMLHGAGGNYTEWTDSYLPERADELIRVGEIQPLIIVMPEGGERSYFANL